MASLTLHATVHSLGLFAELPPRLGERHCVGSVSQNHLESRSPGKKGNAGEERLRKGSFKSWRSHFPNPTKKVRGGAGMFGRSEGLTLPSSPISYSPNIRKIPPGFPLEDLWIWGFGVSPQTFPCLSPPSVCVPRRPQEDLLPSPFNSVCTREWERGRSDPRQSVPDAGNPGLRLLSR